MTTSFTVKVAYVPKAITIMLSSDGDEEANKNVGQYFALISPLPFALLHFSTFLTLTQMFPLGTSEI